MLSNHSSMKKKPSDKEGLLPNGCTGNPLSIDEPRFIHSRSSVKPLRLTPQTINW